MHGFSLIEMMVALLVLSSGLLAVGQMLFVAASAGSLTRAKESAAAAAQGRVESLASLYSQDPLCAELAPGSHGPQQIEIPNPVDGTILNKYSVFWNVDSVPDQRPDQELNAKLISVTIAPIHEGGETNIQPWQNKTVNVSTILSEKTQ
jgi:prepilin-type N-terminal cleavage/methylation domain-containing protein